MIIQNKINEYHVLDLKYIKKQIFTTFKNIEGPKLNERLKHL